MNSLRLRRLSMFMTIIFAASLMVFVTGVFAQPATPTGETEAIGVLESIGSGSIVVSGQTINIVNAKIKNMLVIGGTVKLHVSTVNGVLTAREIETVANTNANGNANANSNTNTNDNTNANSNTNTNDNTNSNSNSNDNTSPSTAVSAQQAIDTVLRVYPTTTISSIELTTKFDGTLVWEVKIRNDIELNIDAQTGVILTIERRGGGGGNNNNQNGNQNGNSNDNNNQNGNQNGNSNDNSDDHGGNSNDNNDDGGSGKSNDNSGDS